MGTRLRLRLGRFVCFGAVGLFVACASAPKPWVVGWQRPYHDLSPEAREGFAQARRDAGAGEIESALQQLTGLIEFHPTNLDLLSYRQDLLLERSPREAEAMGAAALLLAQRDPRPTWLILAARLTADREQAKALLKQAIGLDPDCADAHLGLAALALEGDEQYRWRSAKESLADCLASHPGHMGARRLEAWMFSQEGNPAAPAALARWLIAGDGDPRVRHTDRVAAALDLAALFLGAQDPERALEILDRLQGESHQRPRRLTLLAVARSESGDEDGALWAVSAAIRADPTNSLPRVQEALLLVSKDPLVQAEAWDRVVQVAGEGEGTELAELIQGLRAQVAGTRLRESLPEE